MYHMEHLYLILSNNDIYRDQIRGEPADGTIVVSEAVAHRALGPEW